MKAFLFSDLHANRLALANLAQFLNNNNGIDLIISAGDIVNMGEPVAFIPKFTEVIKNTNLPFFWVPGNNDFGRAYYKLKSEYNTLEGSVCKYKGIILTGVGGSPASWAGQYAGEKMIDRKKIGGSIFVSHFPPPGILSWQKGDCHSPTAKKLSDSPLVHICGHIHHQWGCAYLGQTKVIKLGAAETGFYAILDLENLEVEFGRFR